MTMPLSGGIARDVGRPRSRAAASFEQGAARGRHGDRHAAVRR